MAKMKLLTLGQATDVVREVLKTLNPAGHCYHATEALYYLAGGKKAGLTAMRIRLPDGSNYSSHWYLRGPRGEIIDLTAGQFKKPLDYSKARGMGFRTKKPSRCAQKLIDAVKENWK